MKKSRSRKGSPKNVEYLAPPDVPGVRFVSSGEKVMTKWLIPGAIPEGAITILEGRKSVGKSSVVAAIAACMSGGPLVPGWVGQRPALVLWEGSEDPFHAITIPRLVAAGMKQYGVAELDMKGTGTERRKMVLPDDFRFLKEIIVKAKFKLIVLDPFVSLANRNLDLKLEQHARAYLEPLSHLCEETGCSAILTRHLRKGTHGDAREMGLGSVAIANVARSIIRCDEHPHEHGKMVLSVVACNYGRRAPTQVYQLVGLKNGFPRVEWLGESAIDADEIAEGRGSEAERDEWRDADRLLYQMLLNGPARFLDIQKKGEAGGISLKKLRAAKTRLKITSGHSGSFNDGFWEWSPPKDGWPESLVRAIQGAQDSQDTPPSPEPPPVKAAPIVRGGDAYVPGILGTLADRPANSNGEVGHNGKQL